MLHLWTFAPSKTEEEIEQAQITAIPKKHRQTQTIMLVRGMSGATTDW